MNLTIIDNENNQLDFTASDIAISELKPLDGDLVILLGLPKDITFYQEIDNYECSSIYIIENEKAYMYIY